MKNQKFFNFDSNNEMDIYNFYVNKTNIKAFELLNNKNLIDNIILNGPNKSGKAHLANIWKNNNNAIITAIKRSKTSYSINSPEILSIISNSAISLRTDVAISGEDKLTLDNC